MADTGVGMSEAVRLRAVEPFFTTKSQPGSSGSPSGSGSGLGLSQVDGFANQSGGALEIESTPGVGSVICLLLPEAAGLESAAPPGPMRRRGVLLVEDDAAVRQVADAMLASMGYEVYSAADAAEALLVLQRDTPIDLLFTDIVMPGMNGAELARRAIDLRPNLRVLMASAHPRQMLEARHGVRGDVVVLQKPYRLGSLEQALNTALSETS